MIPPSRSINGVISSRGSLGAEAVSAIPDGGVVAFVGIGRQVVLVMSSVSGWSVRLIGSGFASPVIIWPGGMYVRGADQGNGVSGWVVVGYDSVT